jgi:sugar/nucleoside kinase (ribokinase family)
MDEVDEIEGWRPTTIYEPIPYRCVPEELPALRAILPKIDILSPNAMEALTTLSMPAEKITKATVEDACSQFLAMGVGSEGTGAVIIRSGELGAYVKQVGKEGLWVDAYWGADRPEKVVDVTGQRTVKPRTDSMANAPPRGWKRVSRWLGRRSGAWKEPLRV